MGKGRGTTRYSNGITLASSRSSSDKNANYTALEQTEFIVEKAKEKIAKIFSDLDIEGHPTDALPVKLGTLPSDIAEIYKDVTGTEIEGKELYTNAKALLHHRGGQKAERGKEVLFSDLIEMPSKIGSMDVYENKGAIVFTDYKNKYIVKVNKPVKLSSGKTKNCCHISSSAVIDKKEFDRYNTIKKK